MYIISQGSFLVRTTCHFPRKLYPKGLFSWDIPATSREVAWFNILHQVSYVYISFTGIPIVASGIYNSSRKNRNWVLNGPSRSMLYIVALEIPEQTESCGIRHGKSTPTKPRSDMLQFKTKKFGSIENTTSLNAEYCSRAITRMVWHHSTTWFKLRVYA